MGTWNIVLHIVLAIIWFICGWISGGLAAYIKKRKKGDEESPHCVVLHDYKTSTDYHRLYQLLMEGRCLIRMRKYNFTNEFIAEEMYKHDSYDGEGFVIRGMGANSDEFKNISEEDFVNYCKWKKIEYLDQI